MKKKVSWWTDLKNEFCVFNMYWSYNDGIKFIQTHWWNFPQRAILFIWEEYLAAKVCKYLGHRWEYIEEAGYNVCTRCHIDTEIDDDVYTRSLK